MGADKCDIKSLLPEELEERFLALGEKKYRAMQVFSWLHKGARSFEEMTDLSLELREKLDGAFYITSPRIAKKRVSGDGTVKYLWSTDVETVLMEYRHGMTVCVSTQVGCKMGCAFCASAIGGFSRNLTPSEMLDQVIFSGIDSGKRISNIVLMGIGEPLDNFDNVIRFVRLVCHPKGLNIGARHLTLSTCGVLTGIDRLAQCGVQLSLAISLHAPDDETRTRLVPHNRSTGIAALFEAAARYSLTTGRRVSFEYAMIDGVNDLPWQAEQLAQLLRGTGHHLNLILLSPVPERGLSPSSRESLDRFGEILLKNNIKFTTRRRLGADIEAACGQLRGKN